MTLNSRGRTSAVASFSVAYGFSVSARDEDKTRAFREALDGAVKEVLDHEQLFAPTNDIARTERRGGRELRPSLSIPERYL